MLAKVIAVSGYVGIDNYFSRIIFSHQFAGPICILSPVINTFVEGFIPYGSVVKAVLNRRAFNLVDKVVYEPSYDDISTTTFVSAITFAAT